MVSFVRENLCLPGLSAFSVNSLEPILEATQTTGVLSVVVRLKSCRGRLRQILAVPRLTTCWAIVLARIIFVSTVPHIMIASWLFVCRDDFEGK